MHAAFSLWQRLRCLPIFVRDCGAVLMVLCVFIAGAGLPLVTIPGGLLLLLPALLLAATAFGRNSALLAALLSALALRGQWFGPTAEEAGSTVGLLLVAALLAATLAVSDLVDAWRRSRAEAVQAHARVDATARAAAKRLAAAHQNLQRAEVRLAQSEQEVSNAAVRSRMVRPPGEDPALDAAFRSEGGI